MADRIAARQSGDHGIDIAMGQHAGGKYVAVLMYQALAVAVEVAVPLQPLIEIFDVMAIAARKGGVVNFDIIGAVDPQALDHILDLVFATDQHGCAEPRLRERDGGADGCFLFTLGETDASRIRADLGMGCLQHRDRRIEPGRQLHLIGGEVRHCLARDAGINGCLGDRWRNCGNETWVERHWNNVFRPVAQTLPE